MTTDVGVILSKHRRATHHFHELKEAVETFIRNEPYSMRHDFESGGTKYVYRVKNLVPIPEEINWLIGDTVHNARTCLDHLACALVTNATKTTAFPLLIAPPTDNQGQIREVTIDGGLPEEVRKLVLRCQPFMQKALDPAGHPLAILKELDDRDKHRTLVPVLAASRDQAFTSKLGFTQMRGTVGVLEEGEPIGEFAVTEPHAESPPYFKPIIYIALDPEVIADPKDILGLVDLILAHVERTVRLFEAFL